jgi:S-adenosylmethionine:tRNA ribosyltransferase-isomerase
MAAAGVIADFELPASLEAAEPAEARGLARDEVRLLVSDIARDAIEHAQFRDLPRWLAPGDVLIVNTSGTLAAAVPAVSSDGNGAHGTRAGVDYDLHLSTRLPDGTWVVEVRRPDPVASTPFRHAWPGMRLALPDGARAVLIRPYPRHARDDVGSRLWVARLALPGRVRDYLSRYGFPIRYRYVPEPWPLPMYQTVFATEPGSAEMPSAGRPFTPELVARLVSKGVQFAPILLHTGVASLEEHEPPYEEYYRVPPDTASVVNAARRAGRRIIAVGTTAVRAIETATGVDGATRAGEGWTDLVIGPGRSLRAVNSVITGLHEPRASHLALLAQVVDVAFNGSIVSADADTRRAHLDRAYGEARRAGYLWHEFGDAHLILADGSGRASRDEDRPARYLDT